VAQLSVGESAWRMLRRAIKLRQAFRLVDVRNYARGDQRHFDTLVRLGLFEASETGGDRFVVTQLGREAADLGLYDTARVPQPAARRK
jgi:hypothetical protein